MRIKKIKSLSDGVTVEWQTPASEGKWDNHSLSSSDEPRPEFKKALTGLKPFLISLCEVDSLDKKLIKASGVSLTFKGEKDTMNAVITGQKTYKNSGGCLNFNTPTKAAENTTGKPTAEENLLPEKCVAAIKTLISEAEGYIKGSRSQTKLT